MQVVIAGQVVDYTDEGSGPVLLLVHGWRDQKSTWKPLIDKLKVDFRCIAVDLPNFGASADNQLAVSLAGFADVIAEFLGKLGVERYVYIGHSMGGQIGIYAAGRGVLRPDKLVLLASAGVRDDKATRRKALKAGAVIFRKILPASAKKRVYQLIGSDYDPSLKSTHKSIIDDVLSRDVQQEASRINVPALLIYGSDDTATPPKYGKIFHIAIEGSVYRELPGYDHWLHQKAAAEISEAVREFLRTAQP